MIVRCPQCETQHEVAWAAPSQPQDRESTKFQCFGCGEKQLETPDIPERCGFRIDLVGGPGRKDEPISVPQEAERARRYLSQNAEVIAWWAIIALSTIAFLYLWDIKAHVIGKQLLWVGRMGILLAGVAGFVAKFYAQDGDDDQVREMRIILALLVAWTIPAVIEYVHRFSCPGIHN